MDWYKGNTLMQFLESCGPIMPRNDIMRFSIQYVIDNGYAGKLMSGKISTGDIVTVWPKKEQGTIRQIIRGYNQCSDASAGENICVYLKEDEIVATRGHLISHSNDAPQFGSLFDAIICWLDTEKNLELGAEYILRINAMETICIITDIVYKTDVNSFERNVRDKIVKENEFAKVKITTQGVVAYDIFSVLTENGRGIIIDMMTNYTSGAFIIE